jgi:hypothetical protein
MYIVETMTFLLFFLVKNSSESSATSPKSCEPGVISYINPYLCAFLLQIIRVANFVGSQSQTCTITGPSVVTEHLSAAHLTLAEVFGHSAAHLGEGRSHYFSEVSL